MKQPTLRECFEYLDGVASETEYSYVRTKLGPLYYNVPSVTWLQAVRAFRAWKATLDPSKTLDQRVARAEAVCCYPPTYW